MADWANLNSGENYLTLLETRINDRDLDVIKMLDGVTLSNTPVGAKMWNAINKRWEMWNGTTWGPMTDKFNIDVDTVDGYHAGTGASQVLVLDTGGLVPLANIPATLTGKDADTVDGYHVGAGANVILVSDASGNIDVNGLMLGRGPGSQIENVALGNAALNSNTTGIANTAIGRGALYANTTNGGNTAVGYNALGDSVGGDDNTAVGLHAIGGNLGGSCNTAIGRGAGWGISTGTNLTCVGYNSLPSAVTANNEVTLGDGLVTSLRCAIGTISTFSDARDKYDIADIGLGMAFLSTIRPVKFKWNMRDGGKKTDEFEPGFIAQELQAAQNQAGAQWMGLVLENNPDRLEATPGKLLPVVVRAIQELNQRLTAVEIK